MKTRAILTIALMAISAGIHAQNADDLLLFSENNYEGTARTVAMGNAFTALGGDPGSLTINPAGSAVSKYSQMSITSSLNFFASTTSGTPLENGSTPYFNRTFISKTTDFTIPNLSMILSWDTGRRKGIKSLSFGFAVNTTNSWYEDVYAAGRNTNYTSYMGALAARAAGKGYTGSMILADNAYYNGIDWDVITGFVSYMIDNIKNSDGEIIDNEFVGASEVIIGNSIEVPGPLDQTFGKSVRGSKEEYLFNFGANISDFLYIGMNLGFTSISYGYHQYFKEKSVYRDDFPTMEFVDENDVATQGYFDNMKAAYSYIAEGTGVYAKFGIIVTPMTGLRIGAAFQTPTVTTIYEEWNNTGSTTFSIGENGGSETFSAESPIGPSTYTYTAPLRANFGLAYTFGRYGLVSVDYELSDYGQMTYDGNDYYDDTDYVHELNQDIRRAMAVSHMLRAGLEFKPLPELALRAGYGLTTSARKYAYDSNFDEYYPVPTLYTQNASIGLGYSSKGSFYADIACKRTFLPAEYIMPYNNYIGSYDDEGHFIADARYLSPEIMNKMSLWKVMLTFGWRF